MPTQESVAGRLQRRAGPPRPGRAPRRTPRSPQRRASLARGPASGRIPPRPAVSRKCRTECSPLLASSAPPTAPTVAAQRALLTRRAATPACPVRPGPRGTPGQGRTAAPPPRRADRWRPPDRWEIKIRLRVTGRFRVRSLPSAPPGARAACTGRCTATGIRASIPLSAEGFCPDGACIVCALRCHHPPTLRSKHAHRV